MNSEEVSGARPQADQALVASDGAPTGLRPAGVDPSRTVLKVFQDLETRFGGSWMSNGVASILAHPNLPEVFGKEEWADWTFKPAQGAFEWAHDRGLIVPWKLSSKWTCTPLGREVAAHARFLCDNDGPRMAEPNEDSARGEAGPARAAEGGIAQGVDP